MFNLADIRRLLDAFENSDWDEVHLVADGVDVHIASHAVALSSAPATAPPAPAAVSAGPPAAARATGGNGAGDALASSDEPAAAVESVDMDGAHAVVSPSPGIFWRSPAPGEPSFVEVGQIVTATTPIGIVEVMKLMNQVLAGVAGTVRAVLVENGAGVERDEPMVLIDADA
jgi:acetyl-CoA carboxylase biotin carboxyl carrier protein